MELSRRRMLAVTPALAIANATGSEAGTPWPAEIFLFDVRRIDGLDARHLARCENGWAGPFTTEDCALCWRDDVLFGENPLPDAETWLIRSSVRKASSIPSILRGNRPMSFTHDAGWRKI